MGHLGVGGGGQISVAFICFGKDSQDSRFGRCQGRKFKHIVQAWQENSWLASSQSTHLGPCREEEKSWSLWEKSLNGGEELLHLCVEGGNVLKSGKEVQRQMRRMTIEE